MSELISILMCNKTILKQETTFENNKRKIIIEL